MTDAFVAGLRDEIDEIDRELLAASTGASRLVRRLHDYKQAEGLPLRDPGREESLLRDAQLRRTPGRSRPRAWPTSSSTCWS